MMGISTSSYKPSYENVITLPKTCRKCARLIHPDHSYLCFTHGIQSNSELQMKYFNKISNIKYKITKNRAYMIDNIMKKSLKIENKNDKK